MDHLGVEKAVSHTNLNWRQFSSLLLLIQIDPYLDHPKFDPMFYKSTKQDLPVSNTVMIGLHIALGFRILKARVSKLHLV